MRNRIFKIAMMAAVALTLMAGSAFAATYYVKDAAGCITFPGENFGDPDVVECRDTFVVGSFLSLSGNATPYIPDGLDQLNWNFIAGATLNINDNNGSGLGYFPVENYNPSGTFALFLPVHPIPAYPIPDFPDGSLFQWRNDDLTYIIDNWGGFSSADIREKVGGFFGDADGFEFWITDFVYSAQDPIQFYDYGHSKGVGINFAGLGYVYHDDFWRARVMYTFSLHTADINNPSWNFGMTITTLEDPSEVPEPGTLVLLGTGLLGAALVARKKMTKK